MFKKEFIMFRSNEDEDAGELKFVPGREYEIKEADGEFHYQVFDVFERKYDVEFEKIGQFFLKTTRGHSGILDEFLLAEKNAGATGYALFEGGKVLGAGYTIEGANEVAFDNLEDSVEAFNDGLLTKTVVYTEDQRLAMVEKNKFYLTIASSAFIDAFVIFGSEEDEDLAFPHDFDELGVVVLA